MKILFNGGKTALKFMLLSWILLSTTATAAPRPDTSRTAGVETTDSSGCPSQRYRMTW